MVLTKQSTGSPKISRKSNCPYAVKCSTQCENGYIFDKEGCQTCDCNPCQFRQPLVKYSCEQDKQTCPTKKCTCTTSSNGNAYCCPNEKLGPCPPSPDPSLVLCLPADCSSDADCLVGQRCCDPCSRCTDIKK